MNSKIANLTVALPWHDDRHAVMDHQFYIYPRSRPVHVDAAGHAEFR